MKTFWLMWHYGNPVERITPLRMFHKFDFGIEKEGNKFMKMIKIIKLLTNIAEEKKLIENQQQIKQLPRDKVSEIFDVSFTHLMKKIHGRKINASDRFELKYCKAQYWQYTYSSSIIFLTCVR